MTTEHQTYRFPDDLAANPVLARWVSVHSDGSIDVRVGKVELGQGILTALSQIAADELGADPGQIRMVPANTRLGPDEGLTSGSLSIARSGPALRAACAQVRARFTIEAARRWGVDEVEVTVRRGRILCGEWVTSYGALADAVDLETPFDPAMPSARGDRPVFVGTSAPRLDLPDKIAGRPRFIHDLRLPGQLFGRVLRPPSPGASLRRLDASRLEGMEAEVVRDGSFVGVVGADEAAVTRAVETVRGATAWEEHDGLPDEDDLRGFLRSGPLETIEVVSGEGPPSAGRTLRASYSRPFIAHASMAPSAAAARWNDDGTLSVWTHSQGVHNLRAAIARVLELDEDRIEVEHAEGAGCYGHNGADDVALDAVLLARSVPGRPVHVRWSRPDELTWAPFGSAMSVDVEAVVGESGGVRSWHYDVWSQGHTSRPGYQGAPGLLAGAHLDRPWRYPAPADPPHARGGGMTRNSVPIYDFPRRRVTGHRLLETPIRSSALRSLGAFMNVFAIESFWTSSPWPPSSTRWPTGCRISPTSAGGESSRRRPRRPAGAHRCPRVPDAASGSPATRARAPTARWSQTWRRSMTSGSAV